MKVIVFDKNTKKGEFNNYGYGKLRYIQKSEETEELNGRYDYELILLRVDPKAKYLKKWALLWVDGQVYRIRTITENDKDNTIKAYAKHIFYDINYGFVIDKRAEKATVKEAMEVALPDDFRQFNINSNIEDKNTLYFVKNYGAESMFEIINRWGTGEIVRDNFNISINKSKGMDRGVTFTYKKIEAIEIVEDTEEVITRLYPTGKDGITLSEKYIIIPNWDTNEYPPFHITKEITFQEAENEGDLRTFAKKEAERLGLTKVNFKINVHDLKETYLYDKIPELMNVNTGDIVTIKHEKMNVRVKVKCIKKIHDKATKKVVLEFGQPLKTFFESVDNNNVKVDIPMDKLMDKLFYYTNGEAIRLYGQENSKTIAHIRYSVTEKSNIMMYFNIFGEVLSEGTLFLEIYRDNELLTLKPIQKCDIGHRILSFTYPLLAIEPNQYHQIDIKAKMDTGHLFIDKEQMQLMIKGQGLAGGGAGAPHAEIIDKVDLSLINTSDLLTDNSIKISFIGPNKYYLNDKLDLEKTTLNKVNVINNIEIELKKAEARRKNNYERSFEVE